MSKINLETQSRSLCIQDPCQFIHQSRREVHKSTARKVKSNCSTGTYTEYENYNIDLRVQRILHENSLPGCENLPRLRRLAHMNKELLHRYLYLKNSWYHTVKWHIGKTNLNPTRTFATILEYQKKKSFQRNSIDV